MGSRLWLRGAIINGHGDAAEHRVSRTQSRSPGGPEAAAGSRSAPPRQQPVVPAAVRSRERPGWYGGSDRGLRARVNRRCGTRGGRPCTRTASACRPQVSRAPSLKPVGNPHQLGRRSSSSRSDQLIPYRPRATARQCVRVGGRASESLPDIRRTESRDKPRRAWRSSLKQGCSLPKGGIFSVPGSVGQPSCVTDGGSVSSCSIAAKGIASRTKRGPDDESRLAPDDVLPSHYHRARMSWQAGDQGAVNGHLIRLSSGHPNPARPQRAVHIGHSTAGLGDLHIGRQAGSR